ncbi:MAG: hypothetical protein GY799_29360 [Desulfobulbaceae bacterium]|nr:hypothetical protein [Desulfobulbaceae bacterium]
MSIFNYFKFDHLPPHLQKVSKPLCMVANIMKDIMPDSPEKTAGMRKLLESKDCFVRAFLDNKK